MTAINDISDLIRLMQDDPAWAEALRSVLLSQELLQLPETFAAFVSETRDNFNLVNQRLEALETNIGHLTTGQASMGGNLSRLTGRDYESDAARRAPLMAGNQMKLTTVETLSNTMEPQWLDDIALKAQFRGDITPAEALQLQAADLVLEGLVLPANMRPIISLESQPTDPVTEGHSPSFYLLGEISITIQKRDMTRATNRAAILQKATEIKTLPLLIGTALDNDVDPGDIIFLEVPDFD